MLDKERDYEFCCPPNLRVTTIHGLRPNFTCLARFAVAAIEVFSGHVPELWERRKERSLLLLLFFFFFFFLGFDRVSVNIA